MIHLKRLGIGLLIAGVPISAVTLLLWLPRYISATLLGLFVIYAMGAAVLEKDSSPY